MATHDTAPWIGRMRVLRKTQNHGQECPARGYFRSRASGSATPLRPSARSSATMPVHATAARAGWVPSSVTSRPRSGFALPHDDRARIEIQILDPQLQTLTDPHARSIQKLGEQTMLAFQKTGGCEPLHPGSAPPASAATAEVFRSPEARADPCTAPCRRRTARPPMPDDAETETLRSFASQDRNASTSLLPKVAG